MRESVRRIITQVQEELGAEETVELFCAVGERASAAYPRTMVEGVSEEIIQATVQTQAGYGHRSANFARGMMGVIQEASRKIDALRDQDMDDAMAEQELLPAWGSGPAEG